MQRKADFPALAQHIAEVSRRLADHEKTSAAELSSTILKDYALTTKLLRLVNSPFYGQYGRRISTVSRAVVLLGFSQVRLAALSLLLFEHLDDRSQAIALQEAAGHAFLAGAIGRHLAESVHLLDPEQVFVCAMFRTLGRYLTAYYFPEEYQEIQRTRKLRGLAEGAAAVDVLGVPFEELGMAVAREWHLPPELTASMTPLADTPVPRAETGQERLRQVAALSNELTEVLVESTPAERGAALERLRARFGRSFAVSDQAIQNVVERALDDLKTYSSSTRIDTLRRTACVREASAWLRAARDGPATPGRGAAPETPSSVDGERPDTDPTEVQGPNAVLLAGLQDITQALLDGCGVNDILIMVLETAYRGLGFTRVVLFIREPHTGWMAARFGLGADVEGTLPRLRFRPTGGDDVFSAAVGEQRDLVVSDLTAPRAREDLPTWYRQACTSATLALLPIVVSRVCLGLVYADRDVPERPITPAEMGYLHTLRNQAVLAVRQRG
jgi:HD-like signal output (HDOD) protein